MKFNSFNDVNPDFVRVCRDIIGYHGSKPPTEFEVYQASVESGLGEKTHLGNTHMALLLDTVRALSPLRELISAEINARASYLYISNWICAELSDYLLELENSRLCSNCGGDGCADCVGVE